MRCSAKLGVITLSYKQCYAFAYSAFLTSVPLCATHPDSAPDPPGFCRAQSASQSLEITWARAATLLPVQPPLPAAGLNVRNRQPDSRAQGRNQGCARSLFATESTLPHTAPRCDIPSPSTRGTNPDSAD